MVQPPASFYHQSPVYGMRPPPTISHGKPGYPVYSTEMYPPGMYAPPPQQVNIKKIKISI